MSLNQEITLKAIQIKDNSEFHASYEPEFEFYHAVSSGNIEKVTELCKSDFTEKKGLGKLSESPLQSMKYHFAITAAMLARYAIASGLELESSYGLSDLYIQKCDKLSSLSELSELHRRMVFDFTGKMNALRKKSVFSKQIVLCINYIYENLHQRITVKELAEYTKLNQNYLSRLFKKETGTTITDYIISKKITEAKNMLKYTNCSISLIAETLAFSSQSYFTKIFRIAEGVTPKKYRSFYSFETGL